MRRLTVLAVAMVGALATAPGAGAAPVTVGDPLTSPVETGPPAGLSATVMNLTIAEPGAQATSPIDGVVSRWTVKGMEGGPFRLRILRPAGPDAFTAIGTSAAAAAATTGVETFPTLLPIKAGDTIGLDVVKGAKPGATINLASTIGAFDPVVVEGTTASLAGTGTGVTFAFNAVVQPAPTVTSVSPASGSFKGGTPVTIAGTDFAAVSAVSFGAAAAQSFSVDSETQITAVAPAGAVGPAPVAVTTIAGTATSPAFALTACAVPKLKTKSLKAAKRLVRKAGCRVGKVTRKKGVRAKTGKVVKQGRPAGKKLAPGAKVGIRLG